MDGKQLFEERRSINFFDSTKSLDDSVLRNIINLAVTAPSAFNLQPWEIIAVKSASAKNRLLKLSNNQPKITEAAVTLIIIGDKNGFSETNPEWKVLESMLGAESVKGYQDFTKLLYGSTEERKTKFAESNASLLAMSIMYAAKYYGVESHPLSGIDFEGIAKEFEIGEDKNVVMLISLGYFYSSKELYPKRARKNFDEIVKLV